MLGSSRLADVLQRQKQHLPTEMLYRTDSKFGNIVPAYNNSYDVYINFRSAPNLLTFINQHGFYDQQNDADIGDYLRFSAQKQYYQVQLFLHKKYLV